MTRRRRPALFPWLLLCLVTRNAPAEEAAEENAKADPRWREFYSSEAAAYEFTTAGPQAEALELRPEPVLQWVSLNDFNGDVFVWTRRGRPEVIGTIFSSPARAEGRRNVMHEFHTLSDEPLEGQGPGGREIPLTRPVEPSPIPDAPAPAAGAARLRLQARALAREFSAHMERKGERWELRLLNQPLVEFEGGPDGVLGGAVFAFVGYVTDPEILLLVEARETPDGPRWCYAAARFSDKALWLSRDGRGVWEYLPDTPPPEGTYHLSPAAAVALPPAD